VTSRRRRALLGLACLAATCLAEAGDARPSPIEKLAQAGEISCQPALPVFCANIHVACSGPTDRKAFPFRLRASRTQGSLETDADTAGVAEQYANGRVEWDGAKAYVIVRPREANGYVKLLADGTYSFRHYSRHAATMSRGHCR
jgi:hypothetical protein